MPITGKCPGPPLSWIALLLVHFSDSAKDEITVTALIIWLVIAVVLTVLDYVLLGALKAASGAFLAFILTTGMKVIFSAIVLWQIIVHLF